MSGSLRRTVAAALVGAITAVLGALAAPEAWANTSAGLSAGPSASIGEVESAPGTLRFVVSSTGLPAGATLDPGSVEVTIDGEPVPARASAIRSTTTPTQARTAVLAVDTSGSMAGGGIAAARAAATSFVRRLPSDVRVGVVAFADRAQVLTPPTADRRVVEAAIGRLRAAGGTGLYDGVLLALRSSEGAGRRTVVVLSDGKDTSSRASLAQAQDVLRRSGASLDIVAFTTPAGGAATDGAALARLAAAGRGRVLPAAGTAALTRAFESAAGAFATQALVTVDIPERLSGREGELVVQMRGGDVPVRAQSAIRTGGEAPAAELPGPRSVSAPDGARPAVLLVGLLALFVGLGGLALVLLFPAVLRPAREARVAQIDQYSLGRSEEAASPRDPRTVVTQTALSLADRAVRARGVEEKTALRLDRAAIALRPHEWLVVRASAAVAMAIVAYLVLSSLVPALLLGAPAGWFVCDLVLHVRAGRRLAAFQDQLPDTLQLVAGSLRSGFSFGQALDAVVEQGLQPVAGEIGRALAESRLGVPIDVALDRVADRMDSEDLRWTVMAVRIQREVGGNLAEVLATTVKTMRERAGLRRHVRALSAEGRLSAYVLLALPVFLGTWMFMMRREYVRPLYTEVPGLLMSALALTLLTVGWVWMRKTVKVEV